MHVSGHADEARQDTIRRYITSGVTAFEPQCWKRHSDSDELVPLDWPHALAALFRVRNNLFHGEKSAHIENDKRIVSVSYRLLMLFLRDGNFIY